MAELDWDALLDETAANIDLDDRYWSEECGAFTWDGFRVYFEKDRDSITLTVSGQSRTCGRP